MAQTKQPTKKPTPKKKSPNKKTTSNKAKTPTSKSKPSSRGKASDKADTGKKHDLLSYEIKFTAAIATTVFMVASLYTDKTGRIGLWLSQVMFGLFSVAAYLFPYVFFVILFMGINKNLRAHRLRIQSASGVLLLAVMLFVGIQNKTYLVDDFLSGPGIQQAYTWGVQRLGGGALGNMVTLLVYKTFGTWGTGIVIGTLLMLFLTLSVHLTPTRVMQMMGKSAVATKDTLVKTNANVNDAVRNGWEQLKSDYETDDLKIKRNKQHIIDLMNKELFKVSSEDKASELDTYQPDYAKPRIQVSLQEEVTREDKPLDAKVDPLVAQSDPEEVPFKIFDFHSQNHKPKRQAKEPVTIEPLVETVMHVDQPDQETLPSPVEAEAHIDYKAIKKENEKITLAEKEAVEKAMAESIHLAFEHYQLPDTTLLSEGTTPDSQKDRKDIMIKARLLEDTLANFKIDAKVVQVSKGPMITRFELQPSPGVKVSKIVNLADDIALNLAATHIRIVAPIPGKAAVGIEVPNKTTSIVSLRDVIESEPFDVHQSELKFGLGKDISGLPIVADLAKMPHLLVAGATGSGKSVCVNTIISSILFTSKPDEVKFLMIDPKVVELNVYNGIPHLILPVVTDPKKASIALNWAVQEMTDRYQRFADASVRDITSYNKKTILNGEGEHMPRIVVIIDELADLMMVAPNQVEDAICRLAQMARAAGIHLIVATQRPSVDVITGVIKANIPSRIAFAVSSQIDSRTIIDMAGAEKLLGKGDMLYYPVGESKPKRVQGSFISEEEVEKVVDFVKGQVNGMIVYNEDILDDVSSSMQQQQEQDQVDELIAEAIRFVIDAEKASTSLLQRRFRIGYNRAARMIDDLEARGVIGPSRGSKPREVTMTMSEYEMTGE